MSLAFTFRLLLPPAVFLALYWLGLWVWFHTDDFTLLWLAQLPPTEFWPKLLEPRAQGTFRPLSERLYFYLFYGWFGLDAFPYRCLVFATQIVNLWLLTAVVRKISGSAAAGVAAACFWALHHGLATTMSWSSAYNQALSAFFMLAAFRLFLEFAESGRLWLYVLQWLTFLAGFGALENVVVYPGLLLIWAVLYRRDRLLWVLPLFLGSGLLAWIQFSAPKTTDSELYALHFDLPTLLATLAHYLRSAFAARGPLWIAAALGAALAAGAALEARRGRFLAAFGWGWFCVALAPFLPLSGHLSDYYLFFPAAGLAITAAALVRAAWDKSRLTAAAALAVTACWLYPCATYAADVVRFNYDRSVRARNLVGGLAYARRAHPNQTLLLTGVDESFFYASIYHDVLHIAGLFDVFLAPDRNFVAHSEAAPDISRFFASEQEVLLGIRRESIAVYDASGARLREITRQYERMAPLRLQSAAGQ